LFYLSADTINPTIAITKETFNRNMSLLTSKLNIALKKKLFRCYVWSVALYSPETWTLRKLGQNYFERMEKMKLSEKVTNEQVLDRIGEKRTLLNNMLRRKANWIGHILRRNCLLHDAIEGQMTVVKGVGRRRRAP
jgi:hypothetical protein